MAQSLTVDEAAYAIESGIATDGMATKLRAALDALHRGVPQVRIGGLDALSSPGLGTTLLAATQLA
jgi:acetylglutamate kinase